MASDTDIVNLGLSHFGQYANVASVNPSDGSAEGDLAERFYPMARNELLEEHDWTFARAYQSLAQLTNDRDDWAYKHALPSDCLKTRRLLPTGWTDAQNDAADFEIVGNVVYSNEVSPTLVYTKLLTDTTLFSPLFTLSLSYRVGSFMAGPIVKDPTGTLQRNLRTAGDAEAVRAKVSDANSERKRATHTSTARSTR